MIEITEFLGHIDFNDEEEFPYAPVAMYLSVNTILVDEHKVEGTLDLHYDITSESWSADAHGFGDQVWVGHRQLTSLQMLDSVMAIRRSARKFLGSGVEVLDMYRPDYMVRVRILLLFMYIYISMYVHEHFVTYIDEVDNCSVIFFISCVSFVFTIFQVINEVVASLGSEGIYAKLRVAPYKKKYMHFQENLFRLRLRIYTENSPSWDFIYHDDQNYGYVDLFEL